MMSQATPPEARRLRPRPRAPRVRSRAPLGPRAFAPGTCALRVALVSPVFAPARASARADASTVAMLGLCLAASALPGDDDRQPRFHGPGTCRLSPTAPLAFSRSRFHVSARPKASRELCPNPIRSGTSCRETAAPPAGNSDVASAAPRKPGETVAFTISPHVPHPREGSGSCAPDGPLARGCRTGGAARLLQRG